MYRKRAAWAVLPTVICVTVLPAGCAPIRRPYPVGASASTLKSLHGGRHGGGQPGGGTAAAAALPADFPSDVPIPPGSLQGSTGAGGRWGVLVLAAGSADRVLSSTTAFYVAAGFTAGGPGLVYRGPIQITVVVENRDHGNTTTNLGLGVTRTPP